MTKYLTTTALLLSWLACRHTSPKQSDISQENRLEIGDFDCLIEPSELFDIRIGDSESDLKKRFGDTALKAIRKPQYLSQEEKLYQLLLANEEHTITIFMSKVHGEEVLTRAEYRGACHAAQKVGIGSSLGELIQMYPDLKVFGHPEYHLVHATGAGYQFLLNFESGLDTINPMSLDTGNIKVSAIVLN
jgi:hypothetical protein